MKIDGRTLDHKTLEHLRIAACKRVLEDGEPLLWGGETLLRDGKPVGDLSSASYGHTVGASVALGYVKRADGAAIDAAWLEQAKFEVDLAGTRLKAKLSLRCPYDPAGARIKG